MTTNVTTGNTSGQHNKIEIDLFQGYKNGVIMKLSLLEDQSDYDKGNSEPWVTR